MQRASDEAEWGGDLIPRAFLSFVIICLSETCSMCSFLMFKESHLSLRLSLHWHDCLHRHTQTHTHLRLEVYLRQCRRGSSFGPSLYFPSSPHSVSYLFRSSLTVFDSGCHAAVGLRALRALPGTFTDGCVDFLGWHNFSFHKHQVCRLINSSFLQKAAFLLVSFDSIFLI